MANKIYTAEEMREMAGHLIADICDIDNECNEYRNAIGSFDLLDCEYALSYAADIKERGDEALTALDAMQDNTEHLDIETVKDIVRHILFGAQGSQSNAEKDGAK